MPKFLWEPEQVQVSRLFNHKNNFKKLITECQSLFKFHFIAVITLVTVFLDCDSVNNICQDKLYRVAFYEGATLVSKNNAQLWLFLRTQIDQKYVRAG